MIVDVVLQSWFWVEFFSRRSKRLPLSVEDLFGKREDVIVPKLFVMPLEKRGAERIFLNSGETSQKSSRALVLDQPGLGWSLLKNQEPDHPLESKKSHPGLSFLCFLSHCPIGIENIHSNTKTLNRKRE